MSLLTRFARPSNRVKTLHATELLKVTRMHPARSLWQGILAITQNDANGAIRSLRKADYPKALGVAYYLAGQHILFREQMSEAIRRDPGDFGPYYYLGRHYDSDVDNADEADPMVAACAGAKRRAMRPLVRILATAWRGSAGLQTRKPHTNASLRVAQSQVGLARLSLAAGDARLALTFIRKAIELDSRDVSL